MVGGTAGIGMGVYAAVLGENNFSSTGSIVVGIAAIGLGIGVNKIFQNLSRIKDK